MMEDCARRFGDVFTMRLPGIGPVVLVSSPTGIRQVFAGRPEVLYGGAANGLLLPLVGPRSMLLLDGPEHARQRRLLLPPFHRDRMRTYAAAMRDITLASLRNWPRDRSFSLHPFMEAITLAIIFRTVFGLSDDAETRRFAALNVPLFRPPGPLVSYLPIFVPLEKGDFPGSPYRRFLEARAAVDQELYAMIRRRRRGETQTGSDVFSLLLSARDEDGAPMTDGELRDELMTMIAAGHGTTATQLSFAFERLLATPAALARLLEELAPAGDDLEKIAQLPYLDAVVKETLRLRPIFALVVRRVEAPFEMEGWTLPPGSFVAPCPYLAHTRAESYHDPLRFEPERFLGRKIDPFTWLPFGGGARRCIGWAFAEHEMKVVLATVLTRVPLTLVGGPAGIVRRSILLEPERGTRVRIAAGS